MDQERAPEQSAEKSTSMTSSYLPEPSPTSSRRVAPQMGSGCATCGSPADVQSDGEAIDRYVYAIGRVEPRFPTMGIEKEFTQATGRTEARGLTDRQAVVETLQQNRYLARNLCYVMTIGGLETYILRPRDPMDLDLLVEAIRPKPSPLDLDTVVGLRGPLAPPDMCNGLMLPMVAFDQLYSFDREALLTNIPRPDETPEDQFLSTAGELLDRIMQIADNAGATDEDRALNYLAMRYDRIYAVTSEAFGRNESLTGVEVRPAPLSGARKLFDVIFTYTNRRTDVSDLWSVRVDVTEEFPFLVSRMSPFLGR